MKTLKLKITLLALTMLTFTNCSNDDDITIPTIAYTNTIYEVTFFQEGNSDAPNLNWNGDQGSFSLVSSIPGLTIDTTTGVLNWTKDLPIGIHTIQILATNSAGQTSSELTINNPLQGFFNGVINISSTNILDFELEFNADGTLIYKVISTTNTETGTGTWEKNGSTVEGVIQSSTTPQTQFSGTLYVEEADIPTYIGNVGTQPEIPFKVFLLSN